MYVQLHDAHIQWTWFKTKSKNQTFHEGHTQAHSILFDRFHAAVAW